MHGKKTRFLSLFLAMTLVLSLFSVQTAGAASPNTSKMSDSYKSGPYYAKLMKVNLTGNQITDLIAVAASQLGYHESSNKSDLTGTGTGSGNCTEYGKFTGTNGSAWCASFVSWCFRKANIPTSIMPTSAGVGGLRRSVYNNGATWHSVDSGYHPKTGDLVLYESMGGNYTYYQYASRDANGVPSSSSHVGIVVSDFDTASQTYCVIDGNGSQGSVKYLTKQKLYMAGPTKNGGTMNRIQGFVTPAYTTGTGASYNGSAVDTSLTVTLTAPTDATYLAKQAVSNTNATVVSRIAKPAGSSITRSGLILSQADGTVIKDYGETVTNVSSSTTVFHAWYDINKELGVTLSPGTTYRYRFYAVVNGKTFYGNTYTFQTTGTAPTYTLTFNPAGGSVSPASKTITGRSVAGDLPIATRDGYEFLGWYDASGNIYSASTTVTQSMTLTARWSQDREMEEDTPPEAFAAGLTLTDPVNSRGQVEVAVGEPKLHCKLEKPVGTEVSLFQVFYYNESGTRIGAAQSDFTGDSVLAAKSEANFTIDMSKTLSSFPSLKAGDGGSYAFSAVINGTTYTTPAQKFVLTNGTAVQREYTVTFYDLDNMLNYGEITQTNGQKFILPAEPSRLGYRFAGWKLNGAIITANTTVNLTKNGTAQATWTKVETTPTSSFTDVPKGSWYDEAVTWAVAKGITTGTTPTTFSPDTECTRAEIITFLWRAAGSPEPAGSNPFSDVAAGTYYTKAAVWAAEQGMASGNVFSPSALCTREMAVDFMWKYAGKPSAPQAGFTDVSSSAVNWAVSAGVTNGTTPTTFSPKDTCTRAQIVTFLNRGFGS